MTYRRGREASAVPDFPTGLRIGVWWLSAGWKLPTMRTQTYANHRALPHPVYLLAGPALLVWVGFNLWQAVAQPSLGAWLAAIGTAAILPVWFGARRNSQRMQDRIIRLEMQVRLARLLPTRDLSVLTLPQLVALRFASDRELPSLVERTLKGELQKPDDIKRAITDWQADWLRV
jgi:hypothetical protein